MGDLDDQIGLPSPEEQAKAAWDEERLDLQRKVVRAEAQAREKGRLLKLAHEEQEALQKKLDVMASIRGHEAPHTEIRKRRKTLGESAAFMVASDWHVEEVVDPKTVNGLNEYNPEIAKKSAEAFFRRGLRLLEKEQQDSKIRELVLILGGDLISGYIHEELMESNAMSPLEATLFAKDLLTSGIDFLLNHAQIDRLIVPCVYGNHGRTTPRRRISTGAQNSYEWLLYKTLEQKYGGADRIEFHVADGAMLYLPVFDHWVRIHHGDDVRYQGGVGGLSIPLRKAVDSWDRGREADLTVIGHWHQFVDYGFALINGSLIGFNAYAISCKARFEPPRQAFFLINKERGKSIVAPIWIR